MSEQPPDKDKLLEAIINSPSYRRADEDLEFLSRDELRATRLQLELLKPELAQIQEGIHSTIVVFGSARLVEPAEARACLVHAEAALAQKPADPDRRQAVAIARRHLALAPFCEQAREFGRIVSSSCQVDGRCEYVIVTGGGPGIMEAANRGAADVGAKSMGFNIALPHEQHPNPYITPNLCFQFRYFAIRKMHFLLRAKALVAFPGGFGTMDELFEALTLIQTGTVTGLTVVLMGRAFWDRLINWPMLTEEGLISPKDAQIFRYAETAQEAWDIISANHQPPRPA
jgi:uncharacterized protein (TIGR00730 family)